MAGFNVLNAYDAVTRIPQFLGLLQYGNEGSSNPCYARECKNMMTPGGVLQPAAVPVELAPQLAQPIETLARFYRRWYAEENEKEVLVAASGGKLYMMCPNDDPAPETWTELSFPAGVETYQSNKWSWATYEINEEGANPVDILLLSNALDGMIYVRGDTLNVVTVQTPYKFGVIARYAERIWGGACTDEPDLLAYSVPFDPTNWESNPEIPEDGGGDIRQPSWDGDSFTQLVQFGQQLICFKKNRVWRVLGTDPGEYTFREQYGGGAQYPNTVVVADEYILMLSDDGPLRYDGLSASAFQQSYAKDIYAKMNKAFLSNASACLFKGNYYLSFPANESEYNNTVLIYNTLENTWLVRDDICVEKFLPSTDSLYFTSSTAPGKIFKYIENGWESNGVATSPCKWVGQWNDLNYKDYSKGGFTVYLTAECREKTKIDVSIQTEKKTKTKTYTVSPNEPGKEAKQKRIFFGGRGRRYRVIIESNGSEMWRLISGIQIQSEIDGD